MRTYTLTVQGHTFKVVVKEFSRSEATLEVDGEVLTVRIDDVVSDARLRAVPSLQRAASAPAKPPVGSAPPPAAAAGGAGSITAPIPAMVLAVMVTDGQEVKAGEPLLKVEAMKMETIVSAPVAGTVRSVLVKAGDSVTQGQLMMVIE